MSAQEVPVTDHALLIDDGDVVEGGRRMLGQLEEGNLSLLRLRIDRMPLKAHCFQVHAIARPL